MAPCQSAPQPIATHSLRWLSPLVDRAVEPVRWGAAATLLRRTISIPPPPVRPYFAVCAVESWHRVPVSLLAAASGVPLGRLKRRLAPTCLTPASVAAWN